MKKFVFLAVMVFGLAVTAADAGPHKMSLGGKNSISIEPESAFAFNFGKSESRTEGDPQVHWKGRWFYWPTKTVVYHLPGGVRVIGRAESRTGFTSSLTIIRPGKQIRLVEFFYDPVRARHWMKYKDMPLYTKMGRLMMDNADTLLWFARKAPRIIWQGKKKGWKVMWRGKRQKILWHKKESEPNQSDNPVNPQQLSRQGESRRQENN